MKKISHAQVQQVLKSASATIRSLTQDKATLQEKVASFEKRARAERIAAEMEEKGLNADLDHNEKVAHLLDQERTPNLDVTEEAVKLAALGGVLGEISDKPGSGTDPFMAYIMTGEEEES